MAVAGDHARFDPLRLQKFFFLLDRELDGECGCPHFRFRPNHYGPLDRAVYDELDQLVRQGFAVRDESRRYRIYGLTEEGLERGKRVAATLPERTRRYMAGAATWLFSLDTSPLLSSIYDYAPDMAAKAIRPQIITTLREGEPGSPFLRGMARTVDWNGTLSRSRAHRPTGSAALARHWSAVGRYLRAAMKRADSRSAQGGPSPSRSAERRTRGQGAFRRHAY